MTSIRIRFATTDDSEILTDICFRAKAYWGYPQAFIDLWADELTISEQEIDRHLAFAALDETGTIAGFTILNINPPMAEIEHLYVDPVAMGQGMGAALFSHLRQQAITMKCTAIELDSDPNALTFYQHMGGIRIGDTPSMVIEGRTLPRVRFELD